MIWVFADQLREWLELVSLFIDYEFDESDWVSISNGLESSVADGGKWLSYELNGKRKLIIVLARDIDNETIQMNFLTKDRFSERLETIGQSLSNEEFLRRYEDQYYLPPLPDFKND